MRLKTPGFALATIVWAMGLSAQSTIPSDYTMECRTAHRIPNSLKIWG